jgi:hypothetical protein
MVNFAPQVNLNAKEKFTIDPKEFTIDSKKANGKPFR